MKDIIDNFIINLGDIDSSHCDSGSDTDDVIFMSDLFPCSTGKME
jgi:hypothetical protein